MISTPFSAWIFRIENMRSCLRIVDAPSTPISSDIATSSAGGFFFNSFKCIRRSFLGEMSGFVSKARETAGRRFMRNGSPANGILAGSREESRYVSLRLLSISRGEPLRRNDQKGRTITSTTISAAAIPGISLIIRTARPESGRSPFASFLP